jgi:hypothetical protein
MIAVTVTFSLALRHEACFMVRMHVCAAVNGKALLRR